MIRRGRDHRPTVPGTVKKIRFFNMKELLGSYSQWVEVEGFQVFKALEE